LFLIASCYVLFVVAAWPALCDWLAVWSGLDIHAFLGTAGKKAPGRTTVGKVFGAWLVLALCFYCFHLVERRYWIVRTLALGLALVFNATLLLVNHRVTTAQRTLWEVTTGDYLERQWGAFQRLQIIEHPTVPVSIFDVRKELENLEMGSFGELYRCVMGRYRQLDKQLAADWGTQDEQRVKALYIMNVVAGLWAYGNERTPDRPGGVQANELVHWEPQPLTFQTYWNSPIGCCTDFAYLTKCFLDHEGIENRLTEIPGHIFNEVKLDNDWYILDATTNLFLETSWEELYAAPGAGRHPIAVHVFPHPGLTDPTSPRYRPLAGHQRLMTLVRIANRPEYFKHPIHPELPAYFD
jgi:hypothetical protein